LADAVDIAIGAIEGGDVVDESFGDARGGGEVFDNGGTDI